MCSDARKSAGHWVHVKTMEMSWRVMPHANHSASSSLAMTSSWCCSMTACYCLESVSCIRRSMPDPAKVNQVFHLGIVIGAPTLPELGGGLGTRFICNAKKADMNMCFANSSFFLWSRSENLSMSSNATGRMCWKYHFDMKCHPFTLLLQPEVTISLTKSPLWRFISEASGILTASASIMWAMVVYVLPSMDGP
jgi:hypothetical protein